MEKTKRKNDTAPSRRTWRFFVVLALFLLLMVKFPIRVLIEELLLDSLIWGAITLACVVFAIRTYRHFGKQVWHLVGVMVLCAGLAGWQVFDLVVLRDGYSEGSFDWKYLQPHEGITYYRLRYPNPNICRHGVVEYYLGNEIMSFAIMINRQGYGFGCRG